MILASAQLRALVMASQNGNLPRIGVVFSTNRPQSLDEALERIRRQRGVEVELRIGVHGAAAPNLGPLAAGSIVDAKIESFPASMIFGDILQDLSGQVDTEFISKWDDDDLYGPHHLIDLWILAKLSGRPLVGKAAEFVHLRARGIVVRRQGGPIHRPSRFLAGGALLISRKELESFGGWSSIPKEVDQDLIKRFEKRGFPGFRANGMEFVLTRNPTGHTWQTDDGYFLTAANDAWGGMGLAYAGVDRTESSNTPTPEASSGPTVALIVPNKDNQAAVDRLARTWDGPEHRIEIVIADDRSDPPLRARGDRVTIIRTPALEGFGAGRSRHHAAAHAATDILTFADADMHVSPEALETVVAKHAGRATVVHAVFPFSSIDSEEALQHLTSSALPDFEATVLAAAIPGQVWREPHLALAADLAHPRSSTFRQCVGGFISVDRTVYELSGGFRDIPIRGVEDTEFGYRLLLTGCDQHLYRGPGIVHLGERTFATTHHTRDEERDRTLARLVPIWSSSLDERRLHLEASTESVVPFVGLPGPESVVEEVVALHGRGAAIGSDSDWNVLTAPFCIADRPLSPAWLDALPGAMRAFRERRCGEVLLLDEHAVQLARVTALWALNRRRFLTGLEPILSTAALAAVGTKLEAERDAVRDHMGTAFVTVK